MPSAFRVVDRDDYELKINDRIAAD